MATEPKIGDIVPFDCCGTVYIGRIANVSNSGEYLVETGNVEDRTYVGSWVSREELLSTKYPYGEYIPTEGFDVALMPDTQGSGVTVLGMAKDRTSFGSWNSGYGLRFGSSPSVSRFTHIYIVPPLTTK